MYRSLFVPTIVLCLCFLSFISCIKPTKEVAPFDEKKMKAVLYDIQVAEAYSLLKTEQDSTVKGDKLNNRNVDTLVKYYNAILHHYDITIDELNEAFKWYYNHPIALDSAYMYMIDTNNAKNVPPTP